MAATMLSSRLATTLFFPSQNPNRGSGNMKSCRSSFSTAYFHSSVVRYQDRLSAFGPSPFTSFGSIRGRLYRMEARRWTSRIFLPHLVASIEEVEETYVMVKPDGVQRGLVGDIISRFEKKGFLLKGLKLFQCPKELAEEHYKELKDKSFYPKLIKYITSGPVVCMAWEGIGVVASARKLIGATNPLQADPGTIRGDLAVQTGRNVVHGSDSPDNGHREIVRKKRNIFKFNHLEIAIHFRPKPDFSRVFLRNIKFNKDMRYRRMRNRNSSLICSQRPTKNRNKGK